MDPLYFWELDPDPHLRKNSADKEAQKEPWRAMDPHNGRLEAELGKVNFESVIAL
jgi:hypothetical protein